MAITRDFAWPVTAELYKLLVYYKGSLSGPFVAAAINVPSVLLLGKSVSAPSNHVLCDSVALFFQRHAVIPLASISTIRTIMVPRGSVGRS